MVVVLVVVVVVVQLTAHGIPSPGGVIICCSMLSL